MHLPRRPKNLFRAAINASDWLGHDEDRKRLQQHLVLIRLSCESEAPGGAYFEPCAALRIGWAPGEPNRKIQPAKKAYVMSSAVIDSIGHASTQREKWSVAVRQ
ncbi:hypothetical protein TNCV_3636961 [Trichonephila clavipes]|nr:hypothetical protein TNCV_3636961 [Trichonephila clavipes]